MSLFLSMLLSACGQQDDPAANNYGYGWHYDYFSTAPDTYGLRVRHDDSAQAQKPGTWYDDQYRNVRQCMKDNGINIPDNEARPLVIIVKDRSLELGGQTVCGIFMFATNTAIINGMDTFGACTSHEYVHHFLDVSGFPLDKNVAHDSPLFSACLVISN